MKYIPLTSVETPLFVIGHPLFSSVTFRPIHEKSGLNPVAHTIEETVTIRPSSNLGCPFSIPATRGTCSTPAETRSLTDTFISGPPPFTILFLALRPIGVLTVRILLANHQ